MFNPTAFRASSNKTDHNASTLLNWSKNTEWWKNNNYWLQDKSPLSPTPKHQAVICWIVATHQTSMFDSKGSNTSKTQTIDIMYQTAIQGLTWQHQVVYISRSTGHTRNCSVPCSVGSLMMRGLLLYSSNVPPFQDGMIMPARNTLVPSCSDP